MRNAYIPKFDPNLVPDVRVMVDYNDDLHLGSFEKSNKVWAGTQKKGAAPEITGKPSYSEHATQSIETEFRLTKEIPIPRNYNLIGVVSSDPQGEIPSFWSTQYAAIQQLVHDAVPTQAVWRGLTLRPSGRRPRNFRLPHFTNYLDIST